MENALLYTLSTIAQALAGTVALLSAFALYRMQGFAAELRENSTAAIQPFIKDSVLLGHAAHGRYVELLQSIEKNLNGSAMSTQYNPWQVGLVERLAHVLKEREELSAALWRSLAITLFTICAAVVALALMPTITQIPLYSRGTLIIAPLLFVVCVVSYVPLLRSLLR